MEVEVRSVAGMQGCFAALPLHLIQTLQATYSGFLPPLLALELRPHDSTAAEASSWFVAWIGAASNSNAIEVAEKLAECIGLPNFTQVHVRARADLPKATTVMLEPATEDDWEILELNADFAEEHLLNQVGIVQEGLRFPLWLHGHTVITFRVASTEPEQLLTPNTSYHTERDGQTEIVNKWLEVYLRNYVMGQQKAWLRWLHLGEYCYNTTFHMSIGMSPFMLQ